MHNKFTRSALLVPVLAAVLTLPACAKQATGQVAAVVNGDEITLQEVNGEIGNAKIPEGAQKDKARAVVLQRLIDKRLLEQQAKAANLDRDPDYLLKERQLTQALLIELYAKKAQDTLRVPDQATVAKFMADHPEAFAGRQIFSVDQLRFVPTPDPSLNAGLKDLHSIDAIAAYLTSKNIKFARGATKVDSAQVPDAAMKQVLALPAGEPFVVPAPQGVTVNVITGHESMPLPPEQAQPLAVQMIRSQALDKIIQQRLQDAKAKATITYQSGFGPVATPTPTKK